MPHPLIVYMYLFLPLCMCFNVQAKELEEVQRQLQSELLSAKALYEEQMEAKSTETSRAEEQLKTKYV